MNTSVKNTQLAAPTENDVRWASVVPRDPKIVGKFYYSVKTTGVYCRPSCATRLSKPENVRFHATCEEAEKAEFRPCKRCKPNQTASVDHLTVRITEACRLIEKSEEVPGLKQLAHEMKMSTYHFHRVFKTITGLTPKGYASAHRAKRVRSTLDRNSTVTKAI